MSVKLLSQEFGGFQKIGYPDYYEIRMANLGFQTMYRYLNEEKTLIVRKSFFLIRRRRVFISGKERLRTLESGNLITDFDILGFSVSFELDYLNLLKILLYSGIPPLAQERGDLPLIIVGGPCAFFNPEPLAPFFGSPLLELIDSYHSFFPP